MLSTVYISLICNVNNFITFNKLFHFLCALPPFWSELCSEPVHDSQHSVPAQEVSCSMCSEEERQGVEVGLVQYTGV